MSARAVRGPRALSGHPVGRIVGLLASAAMACFAGTSCDSSGEGNGPSHDAGSHDGGPGGKSAATGGATSTRGVAPGGSMSMTGGTPGTGGQDAGVPETGGAFGVPEGGIVVTTDAGTDAGDAAAAAGGVLCRRLAPLKKGVCAVTPGKSNQVLVSANVLTPGGILYGGQVVFGVGSTLACVGCDCSAAATDPTRIDCPEGVVSPGLVNTHDHLGFSQNAPQPEVAERFDSRQQWRLGLDQHTKIAPASGATPDQLAWAELRFVMGGATSTVGQGSTAGLLRNLETALQEGLNHAAVTTSTFPLDDSGGARSATDCSVYGPNAVTSATVAAASAFLGHVSEGVDAYAANEFRCLGPANPDHYALSPRSGFVHSIALDASSYRSLAVTGTALVWSPRSNISLYGDTARVTEAAWAGALIALGTDWLPTGSMNLLRELACADTFNRERLDGFFDDRALWMMVTANAALATSSSDALGVLSPDRAADLVVFDGRVLPRYRAVIDASPADVSLVIRGGIPLYGDDALVAALAGSCDALDVCGTPKRVCLTTQVGKSYATLSAAVAGDYPAFFCGTPMNEPTCVPKRRVAVSGSSVYDGTRPANDRDGDGVANGDDLCPDVFDPVRPMDSGRQPDTDDDGIGDACDPCPLVKGFSCTSAEPDDRDGDGAPDLDDDCPTVTDATQLDTDKDGKGDACDVCPNIANPGLLACPASIYDVRNGTVAAGSVVSIVNALVTASNAQGYFLQVKSGDPGYLGYDYSGIFVFDAANAAVPGTRITLSSATAAAFQGEIQLTTPEGVFATSGSETVAPAVVTPADIVTGGPRAAALEGVVVEVDAVTVTDANPAPGQGDTAPTHEFSVDAGLRVNDYLYLVTPAPAAGTKYSRLVGVLHYRNGNSKLEPRNAADVVP